MKHNIRTPDDPNWGMTSHWILEAVEVDGVKVIFGSPFPNFIAHTLKKTLHLARFGMQLVYWQSCLKFQDCWISRREIVLAGMCRFNTNQGSQSGIFPSDILWTLYLSLALVLVDHRSILQKKTIHSKSSRRLESSFPVHAGWNLWFQIFCLWLYFASTLKAHWNKMET